MCALRTAPSTRPAPPLAALVKKTTQRYRFAMLPNCLKVDCTGRWRPRGAVTSCSRAVAALLSERPQRQVQGCSPQHQAAWRLFAAVKPRLRDAQGTP